MIWIILAVLGVPLWLIAIALITLLLNRNADPATCRCGSGAREAVDRGNAAWVHDVFAFRSATWEEVLEHVQGATVRPATPEEAHKLGARRSHHRDHDHR